MPAVRATWSRRKRRDIPLLPHLAAIELMIGAFGFFSLEIFDHVGEFTIGLPLARRPLRSDWR